MDVFSVYGAGFAQSDSVRYRCVNAPTSEPVTLAELKTHCSIASTDTSWDDYIAALGVKARATIEKRLSRQFLIATYTYSIDAFPAEISLEIMPVNSVSSIQYIDALGTSRTLANTSYQVDISSPDRPARIKPVWGLIWPVVRMGTYNSVCVTFTAGVDNAANVSVPAKHAIAMLTAQWFKMREPTTDGVVNVVPIGLDWAIDAENPGIYA